MARRQKPPTTPTEGTVKTSFGLPESLHQGLKIEAVTQKRDMKDLVVDALTAYLEKVGSPGALRR